MSGRGSARRWRRALLVLLCLALVGAAVVFGLSGYVVASTRDRILAPADPPPEGVDCILVLGCGIHPDGSPTIMLASRIRCSVELYEAGWADTLLMSGDNSREDYNEVGTMRAEAEAQGVPAGAIVTDHAGFSTYDSLYRARDVFGAERVVIVTQEYHLYRALYLAEALGLEAWGVAADPRNDASQLGRELREILARDKDFFTALTQPEPKFLGDPIPLHSPAG